MAYEQRPNTGSLFRNDKKETESHPDYNGSGQIDGVDYWFNAWLNESPSGKKYFKINFKPKDAQQADTRQPVGEKRQPYDDADEIPF